MVMVMVDEFDSVFSLSLSTCFSVRVLDVIREYAYLRDRSRDRILKGRKEKKGKGEKRREGKRRKKRGA